MRFCEHAVRLANIALAAIGRVMSDALILQWVHATTRMVEVVGIAVLLAGAIYSGIRFAHDLRGIVAAQAFRNLRANLGRSILLGLELLVAADIINTVAIEPSLESVAVLAAIVAIRTFLSFSLELEIEGRWPWQRAAHERAAHDRKE